MIHATEELGTWIDSMTTLLRRPGHNTPSSLLLTLRSILDIEARRVPFTVAEAVQMAEATMGVWPDLGLGDGLLSDEVCSWDVGPDDPDECLQWSAQVSDLRAKLDRLSPTADLAIRLALARWHADRTRACTLTSFAAAGLTVLEDGAA